MTGDLYIDDVDVYATYGAYVTAGGYNGVAQWPSLKEPESNDWHEEDGQEVDLSCPVLDTRGVDVSFAFKGSQKDVDGFHEMLCGSVFHTLRSPEIGLSAIKVRLTGMGDIEDWGTAATVTVSFADDLPLEGYEYVTPTGGVTNDGGYALDGTALGKYGVIVTRGSLDEVRRRPEVKQNLLRNMAEAWGAEYDGDTGSSVVSQSKTVTLNCVMTAATAEAFWGNWKALLYDLVRPDARKLTVTPLSKTLSCYYQSQSVSGLYVDGFGAWAEFTIELNVMSETKTT